MKNKLIPGLALPIFIFTLAISPAFAKSAVVGDIVLLGQVERSGQRLTNDTSVFAGDSIRTLKASGGVLRLARGRVEIGESSEVELVGQNPLRIVVKSGTIAFNFPAETALEIVTPQLEVHPTSSQGVLSGTVAAAPQSEDRVTSRSGSFTIVERQKNGASNHLMAGQILVATLLPVVRLDPQGPLTGAQIAVLQLADGDVRAARNATPTRFVKVAAGLGLASGDFIQTLKGRAMVLFTDQSQITLSEGTTVRIQQQMQGQTLTRRISQGLGNLWFNITKATGTQTTLETPTAVAAIRGTEGEQDVPDFNQSTHSLNEGIEQITEVVTQQSVTIRSGQRVRAIRGIGFTPVVALIAAIIQPAVGGVGGGGAGGAGGGAGGAAAGGGAAGAATGAATATSSAVSSVATTVAAVTATAVGVAAATLAPIVGSQSSASPSNPNSNPLSPPGGG